MRARALLLTVGFSIFATACDNAPAADSDTAPTANEDRGGLGKADLVGTCELPNGDDVCGGHGVGSCWCDDLCVVYEDCCSDADTVCGIDVPEPEGEPCGGFLGNTCADDEYCAYEAGQYCGAADASSTCEPRPEICPEVYMPVCGCDGNSYGNSCDAAAAGTGVLHDGECEPPAPGGFCGGIAGIPCPEGQVCVDDGNDDCDPLLGGADCGGVCVLEEEPECDPMLICTQALSCVDGDLYPTGCGPANCDEPVGECGDQECEPVLCELFCENGFAVDEDGCEVCSCAEPEPEPEPCVISGCNGEICAGEPMFSPCVALPEFACFDTAECGHFGPGGQCGWKQTDELTGCLDSFD